MPFDVKDMDNGLKIVANIPLSAVGEDWNTSTGIQTVTAEDLQSAVDALADPAIKTPRVKLGHLDPRFTPDQMTPDGDIFDGTPVLGRFENLQIGDKGMTLYGDAVGVPEWFATIMPFAYPNRSVEGGWNVKTPTGQEHQFVISAVALLGDEYPAIETLDDLQILFSKEGPDWATEMKDRYVAASKGGLTMPRAERIAASVSVEDIRRSFFEDFATAESGRWDWWTRAVYIEPNLVIATDFDDNLYACPYTIGSDDSVEWGEPAEVFTQYVETESGKIAATKLMATKQPTATFSKTGGSRPNNNDQEVTVPRKIHASVDVPALRSRLGLTADQLPDDATDDQINEALTAVTAGASPDPAPPENPVAPEPGSPEAGALTKEPPQGNPPPSPDLSASASQIDKETLAQLQRDAADGRAAREEQLKARRSGVVDAAIKAGKIPPARKDHYLTLMERDEEGTTTMLASLADNVIPVTEGGSQGDPDEAADASSYPEEWLTDAERGRLAAAREGRSPANLRVVPEAQNG